MSEAFNPEPQGQSRNIYPPKPQIVERSQNAVVRSLLSLFIYALLFYFIFDQNITYIAAILVVIIVHEMGHFLLMRLYNYSNVKIFIVPLLGAFTSGKKQKVSQKQLIMIILAGPVPGIIIGSLIYWFNRESRNETLSMLANSFLIINVLNLLPFYPLDGGRLMEALFFKENYLIRLVFGIISIAALTLLALFFSNLLLLVIPLMIGLELYNENKHNKIRNYLAQERVNYRTDYAALPDKDYWLMRDCLILSFPKKYGSIEPGKYDYSPAEGLFVQHISSLLQTDLGADLKAYQKVLIIVVYLFLLTAPIVLVSVFSR